MFKYYIINKVIS